MKNSEWRYKHLIILLVVILFPWIILAYLLKMTK
nr:MAG TPA: ATPase [Caudoviricetes sp.]DAS14464.1 MAG TPA: ATPase [Caudoviricetes sp.]